MKKIVGILAVAAIATSLFAADVSAKARLTGSLFNYNGNNVSALKVDNHGAESYNPMLSFGTSSDTAGASFKFYNADLAVIELNEEDKLLKGKKLAIKNNELAGKTKSVINDTAYSIWFKPIDTLKVTVGDWSTNLNQEQIGWYRCNVGKVESNGYALSFANAGLSFDLFFATKGMAWFDGSDNTTNTFYLKGQYGADFGTVNAAATFEETFKTIKLGAGYSNNFNGIFVFLNAGVELKDSKYNGTRIEPYAGGNAAGLGWKVFVPVDLKANNKVEVGTNAKIDYNLANGMNVNLEIGEGNWLNDSFGINVKPGIAGNIGGCEWSVKADMNIGGTFTLDVPVEFCVNF